MDTLGSRPSQSVAPKGFGSWHVAHVEFIFGSTYTCKSAVVKLQCCSTRALEGPKLV